MEGHKSIKNFFKYMIIGFLISSVKVSLQGMNGIDIIQTLFLIFMYNLTVGIIVGITGMFSVELYHLIKKNYRNEKYI